jgi:hypothetical protein
MNNSKNDSLMFFGKLAIVAAGGYLLWRNRFAVQRVLEANGISTPWMNSTLGEAVNSGAAKITGSVQNEVKSFSQAV